jgi:hypothetical protein
MKRLATGFGLALVLALPGSTLAFHHAGDDGGLPATHCAADAAVSPSNNNGMAKEAIQAHAPLSLPFAPVGTPGEGQGEGEDHCANHED